MCLGAAQEALQREMEVAWFGKAEAVASFAPSLMVGVRVATLVVAAPLEKVALVETTRGGMCQGE